MIKRFFHSSLFIINSSLCVVYDQNDYRIFLGGKWNQTPRPLLFFPQIFSAAGHVFERRSTAAAGEARENETDWKLDDVVVTRQQLTVQKLGVP